MNVTQCASNHDRSVYKKDYDKIVRESEALEQAEHSQLKQNTTDKQVSVISSNESNIDSTALIRQKLQAFRYNSNTGKDSVFFTPNSSNNDVAETTCKSVPDAEEEKHKQNTQDVNIRNLVYLLNIEENEQIPFKTQTQLTSSCSESNLTHVSKKRKRNASELSDMGGQKLCPLKAYSNTSEPNLLVTVMNDNGGKHISVLDTQVNNIQSTICVDNKPNNKHVSFQDTEEDFQYNLTEEAEILFNRARAAKTTLMRNQIKSDHLTRLLAKGTTPPWALGLSKWPELTTNDKTAFASLQKQHARERTELMVTILDRKMRLNNSEYNAYYSTFKTHCNENNLENDGNQAEKMMDRLIIKEKGRTEKTYREKEDKVKEPTCEAIIAAVMNVPVTERSRNRSRSRTRSRSRSPRGYRGQNTSSFAPRGRSRGRGQRGFTRGNFRGNRGNRGNRGYSGPRNDQYSRVTNSGAFEATQLHEDEAAMILALREARRDRRY